MTRDFFFLVKCSWSIDSEKHGELEAYFPFSSGISHLTESGMLILLLLKF